MSSRKPRSGRRKDTDMVTIETRYMHITDGELVKAQYDDGSLAVQIEYDTGEGYPERETISVNLSFYGMVPPEGHIYVKDYAESEGLPAALVAAGIASEVSDEHIGPFNVRVVLMKLEVAL
jgi:hypothetical protein